MDDQLHLSRRERQIMDVVYARGKASANDVLEDMPNPPSRTAVRTQMRILEEKGYLKHHKRGREYVYRPTKPRSSAGRSALRRVVDTFFNGSIEKAVAAHLSDPRCKLDADELKQLAAVIREARKKGG